MNAIEVFAILQKKIKSALSGIARIEETPTGFKIITKDGSSFSYTIPNFHKHDNKTDILDKFSLDSDGKLLFDGQPIVGEDEGSSKLTKDIIANIDVGNTKSGYKFSQGMTFDEYVQAVHVAYLQPVVALTPNGQVYEIGTNVTPFNATVSVTKKSNPITKVELYLNSSLIKSDTSLTSGGSMSGLISPTSNDTDFSVIAKVSDGKTTVQKKNDFKFVRYGFYGSDKTTNVAYTTSNEVRALGGKIANPISGSKFTITVPIGAKMVVIAVPNTRSISSIKYVEGMNADVKDVFVKTTLNVEGANGYSGISYDLYTYTPAEAFPSVANYNVTLS